MTLNPAKDPMGRAILDYQTTGKAARLRVLSSMFDEDEIPVPHLFRTFREMPRIEQAALELAEGSILDVGAGAGCHALELQKMDKRVTAIDISELSCEAMRARGVSDVRCVNLFDDTLAEKFDTILLLMNGTGIAGKVERMKDMLLRLKSLLNANGSILIDSSDLKYIYENEDGSYDIDPEDPYYGEVDFRMVYKNIKGDTFDWLYLDHTTLSTIAAACGMRCEVLREGDHYDYLARITQQ